MKKLITTALATMVALCGYSQDGIHLPLTGGTLTGNLTLSSGSSKSIGWGGHTSAGAAYPLIYSDHSFLALNSKVGGRLYFNFDNTNAGSLVDFFNGKLTVNKDGALIGTSAMFSSKLNVGLGSTSTYQFETWNSSISSGRIAGFYFPNMVNASEMALIHIGGSREHYGVELGSVVGQSTPHVQNHAFIIRTNAGEGTGHTEKFRVTASGNVGIGTDDPKGYKLAVAGKIRATEIKVEALPWSDFVFEPSYKLRDLKSTEQFIKENKHLPEIPSAAEVAKDGINVGEMNAKLLQKIEELTLYMIEFNKKMDSMKHDADILKQENQKLKEDVARLKR